MSKFNFTATHGVGIMADDKLVADFVRDPDKDTAEGEKVYVYSTDDVKVADLVRGTKGFGIAEVKVESKPTKAADEPEPTEVKATPKPRKAATPKPTK